MLIKPTEYPSEYLCPMCNGNTSLDWDYDEWMEKDSLFATCLDCGFHIQSYVCDRISSPDIIYG